MSVYNHRPIAPSNQTRLLELLEAVKVEYDQLSQDAQLAKSQRDEYEHKVNSQIQEMTIFQQTLLDLERTQQVLKKQYEEEVTRLRQQLDQMQHGALPPVSPSKDIKPSPPALTSSSPLVNVPHFAPPSRVAGKKSQPALSVQTTVPLHDIDPDTLPANMKVEGQDWFALFNPKATRYLNVSLVHSLEHDSVVCCVKFSLDGRLLAAGCNQATYIYNTMLSTRVAVLRDETAGRDGDLYIRSVSFSPDGKYLATGAEDRKIRIWEIAKPHIRCVLQGHEQDIYSLEFSRDGRILVSGSGDRTTRIWDWMESTCLHVLRINEVDQSDPGVTSIAISPDSRLIATGSLDKIIRVWDAMNGQLLERLEGHKDSVYSVAFMPDGKTLVSGSLDKTLRLWQLGNSKRPCIQVFSGHKDFVLSVATTPDDRWIISGSKDRSVQFWDPRTGQTQFMLQGHKNSVISVATSPGRRPLFATGSGDNRARIWRYDPYSTPSS
ncbi:proteinral transcription repressor [Rhizopus stolonifer]|uniref:Proteinral transcription repressor n=1 Tax=Rhizopus stolonifer TaxID=4846 RepID=A0A367IVV7_RHIST|nr:proteinral transcription repressor [Rhizopus stolonifer]